MPKYLLTQIIDTNVKNAFQHTCNLTRSNYLKQHIKLYSNPPWGKPRFRVKSKMATIKTVIYKKKLNRYHLRTKDCRGT